MVPLLSRTDWPNPERVLVIEDDEPLRMTLLEMLSMHCRDVRGAASVAEAIRECTLGRPEIILLDLGLPDGDGGDLLGQLRGLTDVPIIVLSGRDDEEGRVALLDAGADDFVNKPYSAAELLARIRGQFRRASQSTFARSWARLSVDGVEIDLLEQRVVKHGVPQRLTPTEWSVLRALILHAGRPLSARQLWDIVWDREFGDPTVHVRVHITHLRRKVEPDPSKPRLIVTEPGGGYRFAPPN